MIWCNIYKQRKAREKELSKGLMAVAWHSTRVWDWSMTEDKKKVGSINTF